MNHVIMGAEPASCLVKQDKGYEINGVFYMYHKICKNPLCKNHMFTNSRGLAYCSPECNKKHAKRKKSRRSAYGTEFKEAQRLLSRCYDVCKLMSELYWGPKETWHCDCCGCDNSNNDIQVHHLNCIPLDNKPTNLKRLCTKCHEEEHSRLKNEGIVVNSLEVFKDMLRYQELGQGNTPEQIWNHIITILEHDWIKY